MECIMMVHSSILFGLVDVGMIYFYKKMIKVKDFQLK
jgi:hypothetical protein